MSKKILCKVFSVIEAYDHFILLLKWLFPKWMNLLNFMYGWFTIKWPTFVTFERAVLPNGSIPTFSDAKLSLKLRVSETKKCWEGKKVLIKSLASIPVGSFQSLTLFNHWLFSSDRIWLRSVDSRRPRFPASQLFFHLSFYCSFLSLSPFVYLYPFFVIHFWNFVFTNFFLFVRICLFSFVIISLSFFSVSLVFLSYYFLISIIRLFSALIIS